MDLPSRTGKASDLQKVTERAGISSKAFLISTEELQCQALEQPRRVALGFRLLWQDVGSKRSYLSQAVVAHF